MNTLVIYARAIAYLYGPHVLAGILLFAARLASFYELSSEVQCFLWVIAIAAVPAAWLFSASTVGALLLPSRYLLFLGALAPVLAAFLAGFFGTRKEPAPAQQESDLGACLGLVAFLVICGAITSAVSGVAIFLGIIFESPPLFALFWLGLDLVLFSESLYRNREAVRGRLRELQRRSGRDAALEDANRYYDTHERHLRDVWPRERFASELAGRVPAGATPEASAAAVAELLGRLQPLVAEDRKRREEEVKHSRQRQARVGELDRQADQVHQKIERLRVADGDPDVIEDEITGLQGEIHRLEQQKELLLHTTD